MIVVMNVLEELRKIVQLVLLNYLSDRIHSISLYVVLAILPKMNMPTHNIINVCHAILLAILV